MEQEQIDELVEDNINNIKVTTSIMDHEHDPIHLCIALPIQMIKDYIELNPNYEKSKRYYDVLEQENIDPNFDIVSFLYSISFSQRLENGDILYDESQSDGDLDFDKLEDLRSLDKNIKYDQDDDKFCIEFVL